MDMLKTTFIDKGVPVIVGEYGVSQGNKEQEQIENFMVTVSEAIYDIGACPVIWDVQRAFYDRYTCQFLFPDMLEKIMEAKDGHA